MGLKRSTLRCDFLFRLSLPGRPYIRSQLESRKHIRSQLLLGLLGCVMGDSIDVSLLRVTLHIEQLNICTDTGEKRKRQSADPYTTGALRVAQTGKQGP